VFAVTADGNYTVLHTFTATDSFGTTNSDGASPAFGLTSATNELYGTTSAGGANGEGTVFALTTNGNFTLLHTFSALDADTGTINSDGAQPFSSLILSGGTLFGIATVGGAGGSGTVFALGTNGDFRLLHTFSARDADTGMFNSDGAFPVGALTLSNNVIYGVTVGGGTNGNGTVFALTTNGNFTLLHTFSALDAATETTNNDGANPQGALTLSGNTLYGTAGAGGTNGSGTIFALTTNGNFTLLHTFSALDPATRTTNSDGAYAPGALTLSGNTLYGTAWKGGTNGNGTVFALTTNGNFTLLHTFSGLNNFGGLNNDGVFPIAGLTLSGNTLYGTTSGGGLYGEGTVFSISYVPTVQPQLTSTYSNSSIILQWPANIAGFSLQSATTLDPPDWQDDLSTVVGVNGNFTVTEGIFGKQRFFRLIGF
jgi:uncharacterized repeat protein (TIGR03803 family)